MSSSTHAAESTVRDGLVATRAQPEPVDVRRVIVDRLAELGRSKRWLSLRQRAVAPNNCRRYLSGASDTSAEAAGELLAVVGLRIEPVPGFDPEAGE